MKAYGNIDRHKGAGNSPMKSGFDLGPAANGNAPLTNSLLVNYALRGLEKCWLPHDGRWSHIYHLDGRASPNESQPRSDVFYTLNVLLGMSRVVERPADRDLPEIFRRNVAQL